MAKTNPIGVRFDKEKLEYLKDTGIAQTPQQALIHYEGLCQINESKSPEKTSDTPAKKEFGKQKSKVIKVPTIQSTSADGEAMPEGLTKTEKFKWLKDHTK